MSDRLRALVLNKGTVIESLSLDEVIEREGGLQLPEGYKEQLVSAHRRHRGALETLRRAMDRLGWEYDIVEREAYTGPDGHQLVISLGGDGTVLAASHHILDGVPLLGVNSDPDRSTGYFCAETVDSVEATLRSFQSGELERFELARLRVWIDDVEAGPPVLNDILVGNANPAATARYMLICGRRAERQKSSGIWISTPAGSTAGIRSAGGVVLPLAGALLQYLVREPVFSPGQQHELLRGVRDLDEGLEVVSYMAEGTAYIDGPFVQRPLPLGARLKVSAHQPLVLLGLQPDRRER